MDGRVGFVELLVVVASFLVVLSLVSMMGSSVTVILAVENMNSLTLCVLLMGGFSSSYCLYVSLVVLFVVESVMFLSCLVTVWNSQSYMVDLGGF